MEVDTDAGPTLAVPSAVGIPGEQTVWLRLIAAAVGQRQLENLRTRADVQVLLQTNSERRRRRRSREKEEDKEQIQPSPRDRNQREMKNKEKDKQRERGRVTQLGVIGDNGIITLNYNNIHPPDPLPIQSGLRSFRESCYKMSGRG